jgi:hypothetical protein
MSTSLAPSPTASVHEVGTSRRTSFTTAAFWSGRHRQHTCTQQQTYASVPQRLRDTTRQCCHGGYDNTQQMMEG